MTPMKGKSGKDGAMSSDSSPLVLVVRFDDADELESAFQGQIKNGGYFISSDDPAPRTTAVEVRFHLPGIKRPVAAPGEVAFQATVEAPMPGMGPGMAIQFDKLSDDIIRSFEAAITVARTEGMDAAADPGSGEEWDGDLEESDDPDEEEDPQEEEESEESINKMMIGLNQQTSENLYQVVRQMKPHQKVVAAKRGNRNVRNLLIKEGNKKVLNFILQNPQLSVPEVAQMLKAPNLPQDIIQNIAKNANWCQSEDVRLLIVTHPKTPLPLALKQLIALNQQSLAKLAKSQNTKAQIKSNALKLLEQRRKGS